MRKAVHNGKRKSKQNSVSCEKKSIDILLRILGLNIPENKFRICRLTCKESSPICLSWKNTKSIRFATHRKKKVLITILAEYM